MPHQAGIIDFSAALEDRLHEDAMPWAVAPVGDVGLKHLARERSLVRHQPLRNARQPSFRALNPSNSASTRRVAGIQQFIEQQARAGGCT